MPFLRKACRPLYKSDIPAVGRNELFFISLNYNTIFILEVNNSKHFLVLWAVMYLSTIIFTHDKEKGSVLYSADR